MYVPFREAVVKPGGLLLLYGVENGNFYTVGDLTFQNFPVTSKMAMTAMKNAEIHPSWC